MLYKIVAISDLHGYLPMQPLGSPLSMPDADFLLVAGDITPGGSIKNQTTWLSNQFDRWTKYFTVPPYVIAGNHDSVFAHMNVSSSYATYVNDSQFVLSTRGSLLKGWGSPWTLPFHNWSFMCKEDELRDKYERIPADIDIVMTHGPPYGILDQNVYGEHCGSIATREMLDRVKPKLHVFGHIHEQGGKTHLHGDTICANVSYVDRNYQPTNEGQLFLWDTQTQRITSREQILTATKESQPI